MNKFSNNFLKFFSFVHKICPLCVISRKFPKSKFAKAMSSWSKVCPFCNIYFLAKKRKLI